MDQDPGKAALAHHLDAINRRVQERGPTPDSAARLARIVADSEAACSALRRVDDRDETEAAGAARGM